jgi:TonB-linked SusC/RagA family outer membrane protein
MQKNATIQRWLMRLSFFMVGLLTLVTALADPKPGFSQMLQKKVTKIVIPEGSLSYALRILEGKTPVKLAYDENAVRSFHVKKVVYSQVTVGEILTDLLGNIPELHFEEKYNTVIIFPESPMVNREDEIRISGRITTAEGEPLVGATVLIKGTNLGTSTDAEGRYVLNVPNEKSVIVVSYLGYITQEVTVGTQTTLDFKLMADLQSLSEVVVVGYGTQKKSEITGAVSQANLANLNSRSLGSAVEALQGTVPGVTVLNEGGDPTSTPRINIRGLGGINGESPLIILDGVIYSGSLAGINPNDIESISVLKDASAAIYGARAAGGVVLITSKKGKSGEMQVSLDAKFGFQSAWKKLEPLDATGFAEVSNLAADNAGLPRKAVFNAGTYPDGQITRTHWMDEIFRKGKIQDYNVNIRGGGEKSTFFSSFGYRKNEGILLNTASERYNFRLNSDHKIKPWLTFGENLLFTYTNGNGANTNSGYTGAIITAIYYPPNVAARNADGTYGGLPAQYAGSYGDVINPVAYLERLDYKNPTTTLFANPYAELLLLKRFKFRSNLGFTRVLNTSKEFNSRVLELGKIFDYNQLSMSNENSTNLLAEQTLSYDNAFGKHRIDIVAGYTYQKFSAEYFSASSRNFLQEAPEFRYFSNINPQDAASNVGLNGGSSKEALLSYLGRVNYAFMDKYLLTAIIRRDGTSKIASLNRWQNYPGVSLGWKVSSEPFMQGINWLSFLKLRGSWGQVGNLAGLSNTAVNPPLGRYTSYLGQDVKATIGFSESFLANPNVKWAYNEQSSVGADAAFLNDKIKFSVDLFKKTTRNMILQVPVPSTAGVSGGPYTNLGSATDTGLELALGYHNTHASGLVYSVDATFTSVRNKVESFDNVIGGISPGPSVRGVLDPVRIEAGQSLYSFYVIQTNGIFQTQEEINNYLAPDGKTKIQPNARPGDIKFIDANKDGVIDSKDRVFVGSAFPKFTYGFNINIGYKGFDLNLLIQGVAGNKLFNSLKYTGLNASEQGYNMLADIKNAWSPQNTGSSIPIISASDPNRNFGNTSDFYIEKGDYTRLRNFTLGYTLPETLYKKAGLSRVRVYVTGQNLLTFTKYKGMDPEVGLDDRGVDEGRYPQSRIMMFGLNVGF